MPLTLDTTPRSQNHASQSATTARDWTPRVTAILSHIVHTVAKHWLLMVNTVFTLYAGLPALAPTLMAAGYPSAARVIYTLFLPSCHQLPERSFFLFGPRLTYTLEELETLTGASVPLRYVGSPALGYKVAVCERDTAVYLALLLAGMAFALLRRRLRPVPIRIFALLCLPIVADGLGQLIGLWVSSWWSRVASGTLFGIACVWLAYPYIEAGMKEVLETLGNPAPPPARGPSPAASGGR